MRNMRSLLRIGSRSARLSTSPPGPSYSAPYITCVTSQNAPIVSLQAEPSVRSTLRCVKQPVRAGGRRDSATTSQSPRATKWSSTAPPTTPVTPRIRTFLAVSVMRERQSGAAARCREIRTERPCGNPGAQLVADLKGFQDHGCPLRLQPELDVEAHHPAHGRQSSETFRLIP